jgi:HAE1 family hydrophobic/amphiphilic exporter-1
MSEKDATSTDDPSSSKLFSLLVDRPVLTAMITLALLLVGTMSLLRLPLTFMGEGMSSSRINVFVPVSQARSPREIEDKIAKPGEELIRTISGIKSLRTSCSRSSVRYRIELDNDLDATLASAEVRDRLQRAMLEWPDGIDRYFTWREDGSSAPLQYFQILTPEFTSEWQNKAENIISQRLEAVDGVGRIDIFGVHSEAVRIWFDRDKLLAHRVDYRDLQSRLARDNFTEPAGEIKNDDQRILLRVESKFRTLIDIEEYPVRPGLKLKDLARVERDRRDSKDFSRYNGQFTFTGSIRCTSDANPVAVSARVRAETERLKDDPRLKGVDFRFLFDQGEFIKSSLGNLQQSIFKGGFLALLVLLLFLRNLRGTLAIGLAIPLTILIVADYLYFSGSSLNILTMTGMTLAVGMVVDNSVVVLENIRRLRLQGLPLRTACIQGAREVSLAVTMATLTTVVVFLPIIFMGSTGAIRAMCTSIGVPFSVALLGSLFIALLLLPSGIRQMGGMSASSQLHLPRVWSPVNALISLTQVSIRWALRHRYKILISLLLYGSLVSAKILPTPLPELDFETGDKNPFRSSDVSVRMTMPRGVDDEDVYREVQNYERIVNEHKEEWKVKSVSARYSRTSIRIDIELKDEVSSVETSKYDKLIEEGLPQRPGYIRTISDNGEGDAEETDQRNFVIRLRGRDSEHLAALGLKLQTTLENQTEVDICEVSSVSHNEEVVVNVNRDRLQELAVGPEVLFGTLSGGLQGREFGRFEQAGNDIRMITQFDDSEDASLAVLKETKVFSNRGSTQRVGDMADVNFTPTMGSITRVDGRTTVTVLGRRTKGIGPKEFTKMLGSVMAKFPLPRGYEWSEHSMSTETAAQITELLQAGVLSIVLVFLLMGILFESIVLPLSILVTIGISVLGGMWALKLFHGSIDPMAVIGLILLAGVVVNNGIVLLDCIERLRRDGKSREDAIQEGVKIRLLPIFMTASTTIVALLPMAIYGENTGQGVNYISLSITVSGGLALCTLLAAPAVTLAYTLVDDFRVWLRNAAASVTQSATTQDTPN